MAKFKYPTDEATAYAIDVVSGKVMAGPYVRGACKRHLSDLEHGHKRGLVWHVPSVERVLRFFRVILKLNGGQFEGQSFNPLPWQCFILGSLFGWLRVKDGKALYSSTLVVPEKLPYRRFRMAYQETGKGSGKSPLAAGIGLYMEVGDNEARAEVYAAANKRDQAMVLFRDAVAMVDQSTAFKGKIKKHGKNPNVWQLSHPKSDSFFKPIASEEGQSGPRPHCGLLDEIHEHKDNTVVEMMRAGTKFRRQPLIFMITNSGADRLSVCFDYHTYGAKVATQMVEDDTFFAYICALDKGEDPFKSEKCWPKVNPSLGAIFDYDYLREQVREARGMPSKESKVRRLNFCEWVGAVNPWLSDEVWQRNKAMPMSLEELKGMPCYCALDLSKKNDLTAFIALFLHPNGSISVHPFFWMPEDVVSIRESEDRQPYSTWVKKGLIHTTPGPVIQYSFVASFLMQFMQDYEMVQLRFDRWRMADLLREFADEGKEDLLEGIAVEHGQGFKDMHPAIEAAEDFLAEGRMRHGDHPVLTMCVANAVVVKDPAEQQKFDKTKATGRIDGAQALAMASRGLVSDDNDEGDLDDFISNPIRVS